MTGRVAVQLGLVALLAACQPSPGDPCEPGTDPILIDEWPPPTECGWVGPGTSAQCGLICTGGSGCEGEPSFRWMLRSEENHRWCGCDGVTYSSQLDSGSLPSTRWRWFGSCDDPCADVDYVPSRGWRYTRFGSHPEVAPACTTCRDAIRGDDGCVSPDGMRMPYRCCNCAGAVLAADGSCRWSEDMELELSAECCAEL